MDVNPPRMAYFEVNGDIIIQDSQNINITAENIWIKGGSIKAGNAQTPFTHNLTFQLNGDKNLSGITISPDLVGNKLFVVTGRLELYGVAPETVWTRLTAFADKGATSISVSSTTGWKVDD